MAIALLNNQRSRWTLCHTYIEEKKEPSVHILCSRMNTHIELSPVILQEHLILLLVVKNTSFIYPLFQLLV